MAHKKKGHLTASPEWAKHLRKFMKKQFWKGERNAGKELIRNDLFNTDNLMWQFEELVKTLIAMSLPYKNQKEFYGIGVTADEMLEDFYSYYTLNKERYIDRNLIENESKEPLDDIESLTDKWCSEKEDGFWYEMEKHQEEWNILREKAKLTLVKLKKDNFRVEVKHENEFDDKGKIISQKTRIELKENKDHS